MCVLPLSGLGRIGCLPADFESGGGQWREFSGDGEYAVELPIRIGCRHCCRNACKDSTFICQL